MDSLLALEAKQSAAMSDMQTQIDALAEKVGRLETREELNVVKCEAAARSAATIAATHALFEVARRVGVLEERSALPSPKPKKRIASAKPD